MTANAPHQYVHRETSTVRDEHLFADRIIRTIYSPDLEYPAFLYKLLSSARASSLLAFLNYDFPLGDALTGGRRLLKKMGVDLSECLDPPEKLNTARKVFERRIKYWERRPMPLSGNIVVSPSDAKMIAGSFMPDTLLFLKEKFFNFNELIGPDKHEWLDIFDGGDFAIFRLTPEKYHYNHVPVSGRVADIYEIDGCYHSCNPGAVISLATPFSKNKRVVTVIDTDLPGGSFVGKVAMIEIVALMIGEIVQCYSESGYEAGKDLKPGMMLKKGQPKSLFRPGSSVDVLVFEKDRIEFSQDILRNQNRLDIKSRFSSCFKKPLVETEVMVRSAIARAKEKKTHD